MKKANLKEKHTQAFDVHAIMQNRFWTRKEMPNNTPFYAHGYVLGDGDEVISGHVYFPLTGVTTKEQANDVVQDLMFEVCQDLSYYGGRLDYLEPKKNSKFKAKK